MGWLIVKVSYKYVGALASSHYPVKVIPSTY